MPFFRPSYLGAMSPILALAVMAPFAVPQVASPLQVDHDGYRAACIEGKGVDCRFGFTLIATYENRTSDTDYVSRCGPRDKTPKYSIEPFPDTTQRTAYARMWACVAHDFPIVTPPHTVRVDTLRIEGPNAWDGRTYAPLGILQGQFRLIYEVRPCRQGRANCSVQPEYRWSQTFRVHLVQ